MYVHCSRGIPRPPRSKGGETARATKPSNYTGCPARITLKAVRDADTGLCTLVTSDKVNFHNHACSQAA